MTDRPTLAPDGFDLKINAIKSLKTGAFAGAAAASTAFLTAAGLVPFLVSLLPAGSIPPALGTVLVTAAIGAAIKSIENWIRNHNA